MDSDHPNDKDLHPTVGGTRWLRPTETSLTYMPPFPPGGVEENPQGRDFKGLLQRRKWTILLAMAAVLAAVAIFTYRMPRTYQSNATVMVENPGGEEAAGDALVRMGSARSMETEMQLIESRRVAQTVAESLGLAAGAVQGQVSAAPLQADANLILIACTAQEPTRAHSLCEMTSKAYMQLRTELQRSEAITTASVLEEQVEQVGLRLRDAESALGDYQSRNQAVALDARAAAEVQMQTGMRAQRNQLESERAALATLLRQMDTQDPSKYRDLASFPTFVGTQNQVISGLVQNLIQLENRRADLAVTRTERNPDMIAIDQRVGEIERQLRSFSVSYEKALGAQIASLGGTIGGSGGQLSSIPQKMVETSRLDRQVALLDDQYRYLTTRLREAEVASMVNLPSVRIVDEPSMPMAPIRPNVQLNLVLGALLGLGFGLVLAFYREHSDSSIRGRKEVERETGIPVLGLIPGAKKPGPVLPVRVSKYVGNGAARLPANGSESEGRALRPVKLSWEEEVILEAFRSLAADLRFTGQSMGNGGLRSVAVTSSSRSEGKTFTACNLAIARASEGARTLLIDADLRASGVARFFDIPWTTPGLTDLLISKAESGTVLKQIETGMGTPLEVMLSGKPNGGAGGVLERHSEDVERILSRAETEFDLVVVDTPPLNVLTDAATIASRVDAVVVVVRGGVTDRSALELTLERLSRANAHVVGIVLNDVDLPEHYVRYSQEQTSGRQMG